VAHTCNSSCRENDIGRVAGRDYPGKKFKRLPSLKIARAKLSGGLAQAVEHLLCNHEAMCSTPVPQKRATETETHRDRET
jgi:hypothetical protein